MKVIVIIYSTASYSSIEYSMEACVKKAEVIKVNLMNFMGYRNMVLEQKIKECLDAVRQGETEITIDRGDLTDDEVEYLQSEIERRIGNVL